MKQSGSKIESVGVYFPGKVVTTADIVKRLNIKVKPKLELLTGIASRRVCSDQEDSLTLAVDAARNCLSHSAYDAADIDMVIYCSISKYVGGIQHQYDPPMSLRVRLALGNQRALFFDISNACAGMMTGVHIANNFISQKVVRNCLVVSGEFISSISNNAEKNIHSAMAPEMASLTVGDAGAAVILDYTEKSEEQFSILQMVTLSRYSNLCIGKQASSQPGGTMKTFMKKIHEASIKHAPGIIDRALIDAGLHIGDIDYMIPHQTARQSILAGQRSFNKYFGDLPGEVIFNLKDYGNTASTTHFTTLYKSLNENVFKKGDRIMMVSFASGLVIGVMVFTIHELVNKYGSDH